MALCANYIHSVYDDLRYLHVVDKQVSKEHIDGLGAIIAKFGYENDVMTGKAHRHFDLSPEEAMLAMLEQKNGDDGTITRPASLEAIEKCGATPNVIALAVSGHFSAVNYIENGKMPDAFKDEAFLTECAEWLHKHGMADKLVLGIGNRHPGKFFVEENDEKTRTSAVRPLGDDEPMPNGALETWFGFERDQDEHGKMVVTQTCIVCCTVNDIGVHSGGK